MVKCLMPFPNFDDVLFQKTWKKFMLSDVKKIAHNLQYENTSQKSYKRILGK